ncbi:hypothetical protein [Nitrobacter sp. NHB1]|uniref:hypothetical protein n=1 Tax=Nitrobacter sp. NHB1 TaxID=3119830 RepID=UPI003FA586B2
MALYFGTLLLTWWLISAEEGPKSYRAFEAYITSPPGEFVLFCFTWSLIHHLLGGCSGIPSFTRMRTFDLARRVD